MSLPAAKSMSLTRKVADPIEQPKLGTYSNDDVECSIPLSCDNTVPKLTTVFGV